MSVHRYWRINITVGNNATALGIGEIEMFAANDGGSDLCTGGVASASAIYSETYNADKAFDNDLATAWLPPNGVGTGWIAYDLGSGNDAEINRVKIWPRAGLESHAPKTFSIQYSDNDSDWYDWWTETDITDWIDTVGFVFYKDSSSIPEGYGVTWRIECTDSGFALAEVEMRETVDGADLCEGGWAFASSIFNSTYAAEKAFDNDNNTAFVCQSSVGWLAYDFLSLQTIAEMWLMPRDGQPSQAPNDFKLQYSIDNITFVTAQTYLDTDPWTDGVARTFLLPTFETETPPVRLRIGIDVLKIGI